MSNKVEDIDIKNRTYYLFNDIIDIKNVDPNNIKMDEQSYKNILIYYIEHVTVKDSKYVQIYSANPLYLIFNKVNGYFEEINTNKHLTLVPTNESKEKIKKYEELWSKIRDLIRSITKNSDDYDQTYMKIKFNSDGELPLNKTVEILSMTIVKETFHSQGNFPQSWKFSPIKYIFHNQGIFPQSKKICTVVEIFCNQGNVPKSKNILQTKMKKVL